MKTGSAAPDNGNYVSECCFHQTPFDKNQTLTRCPACSALTIWEFAGEEAANAA
jgi:hypothetical protein